MKTFPSIHAARLGFKVLLSSVALLVATSLSAQSKVLAQSLTPLTVAYTINLVSDKYGNATLGKVQTTLAKKPQGYSVTSTTKTQGLAAILLGSNYQESCDFSISEGRAVSTRYVGGRSELNEYEIDFDWAQRKINFSDGESLDMPQGYIVDNCNMLFAAALLQNQPLGDEVLYIVDGKKKRIRGYRMTESVSEKLVTSLGDIDTVRVTLERELIPERTITLWMSPRYSWLPLKMVEKRRKRTTTFMVDDIES